MTDRELLELAAKASGIVGTVTIPFTGIYVPGRGDWNPLTDDGDALRLAVKLRMRVILTGCIERGFAFVQVDYPIERGELSCLEEESNGDHEAATRRAIVRAAAEIGKAMTNA
jgi:hypothetical protein